MTELGGSDGRSEGSPVDEENEKRQRLLDLRTTFKHFNNLNASLRLGQYYFLDPMEKEADPNDVEFQEMLQRYRDLSNDIVKAMEMEEIGLTKNEAIECDEIIFKSDDEITDDDLVKLANYLKKVEKIYNQLCAKGYADSEMGVV